ncbi:MAG: 3'-5' exonuclease [Phycisphaerales bacterium]|nr:MAG: 3'-5' exonuclease [Phycisphaerales bacterium]
MSAGIASLPLRETPVAVIDFETTGLTAGVDRVIEISVVRVEPGNEPRLVLDTLVHPHRRVAATEIHGITDADVENAPSFRDIVGEVVTVLDGCVIAAYNVYFDIAFLNFELANAGVMHDPPHFCLMYMRPLLDLGPRCRLEAACQHYGIQYGSSHVAANDAIASGRLLQRYTDELHARGLRTFGDLARLKSYKFFRSFANDPFPPPTTWGLARCPRLRSRAGYVPSAAAAEAQSPIRQYWDALKTVLADLDITDDELRHIVDERKRLGLDGEQVRMVHARAFAAAIAQFCSDERLDDQELVKLRRLRECLSRLGWAPGE